jgi:CO dehydrogenase maturation factor
VISPPTSTLRISIAGKGGTGKTVIAAALARFLGRAGRSVLAVDCDSNPMLAISLGVPVARLTKPMAIPTDFWLEVERLGEGRVALLREDPSVLAERHGIAAPDNVTLLAGAVVENEGCTTDAGVRAMLGVLLGTHLFERVVTDFEAGVDEPAWALGGLLNPADVLLVVATSSPVAITTAQRIVRLAREREVLRIFGVANQVTSADGLRIIEAGFAEVGLTCPVAIPFDPAIEAADVTGEAVLDGDANSPGLNALRNLAAWVEGEASH